MALFKPKVSQPRTLLELYHWMYRELGRIDITGGGGIGDAPADDLLYARSNNSWDRFNEHDPYFEVSGDDFHIVVGLGNSQVGEGVDPGTATEKPIVFSDTCLIWQGSDIFNSLNDAAWTDIDPSLSYEAAGGANALGYIKGDKGVATIKHAQLVQEQNPGKWVFVILAFHTSQGMIQLKPPAGSLYTWVNTCVQDALASLRAGTDGAPKAFPTADHANTVIVQIGEPAAVIAGVGQDPDEWVAFKDDWIEYRDAIEDQLSASNGGWASTFYTSYYLVEPPRDSAFPAFDEFEGFNHIDEATNGWTRIIRPHQITTHDGLHFTNDGANQNGVIITYADLQGVGPETLTPSSRYLTGNMAANYFELNKVNRIDVTGQLADYTSRPAAFVEIASGHAYDYFGSILPFGVLFSGTHIIKQSAISLGMGSLFAAQATLKNDPGVANTLASFFTVLSSVKVEADNAVVTHLGQSDFVVNDVWSAINGGSMTVEDWTGYKCQGTIHAGVVMQERFAATMLDFTGLGIVGANIGLATEDLTKASMNIDVLGGTLAPIGAGITGNWFLYQHHAKPTKFNGAIHLPLSVLYATNQTLDSTQHVVFGNIPGGGTFTLPECSTCIKREYVIKNYHATNLTIQCAAGDFVLDTFTTTIVLAQHQTVRIVCLDVTFWCII